VTVRLEPAHHLYVHLPFCLHRCGYCDFVTVVGRADRHGAYVDALLVELERERAALADPVARRFGVFWAHCRPLPRSRSRRTPRR
jgi:coproporphyrinogen III oxidase-like Fe-S oxidoreductase